MALVDVPLTPDLALVADRTLIERVLTNFIEILLKIARPGGRIELSCSALDASRLCFRVANIGATVAADRKDIFIEKYGGLNDNTQGDLGIGLSMCKKAVELHHGRLWVESEPGKSCSFALTISRHLQPTA